MHNREKMPTPRCLIFISIIYGLVVIANGCKDTEFKCRDGTCVKKKAQCNGLPECRDWSDETLTACRGTYRPVWNLVYACGNAQVRSVLDDVCPASCAANSFDCALSLLTLTVQSPPSTRVLQSCLYPTQFLNGRVSVNGEIDLTNMTAAHGSDLRFACNERYELLGKSKVFCQYGQWSDELPTCVRSSTDRCVLPRYPDHGQYIVAGNVDARPGKHYENAYLIYSCDTGYQLLGDHSLMCHQGNWSSVFPTCQKLCRLNTHVSVDYSCIIIEDHRNVGSRPCREYEPDGTMVRPQCRSPNYYHAGILNLMHCIDGDWDYVAVCNPECGKVTPDGTKLLIGGRPAKVGELPWHAGIYTTDTTPYLQICGASLVSPKMVISAAHCFWNDAEERLFAASRFAVALGKIYRPWNNSHDTSRQQFSIQEIKVTPRYRGSSTLYQEDIALVMLSAAAVYGNNVRPVCIDFEDSFNRRQLEGESKGKIAGWGLTGSNGLAAPVLRVLELPVVPISECIRNMPTTFRQFITSDKICAGYWNGSMALCHGDSGGGLAFAEPERASERYYLRGVASMAPRGLNNECNARAVSTFTIISKHEDFIKENLQAL